MTINDQVKAALAKFANPDLLEEIEHYLCIDDDEQRPHDYYDALDQAADRAEEWKTTATLKAARRCLVELGVYRSVTEEQLRRTQTLGGQRKYAFQLDKIKYQFNAHPEGTR